MTNPSEPMPEMPEEDKRRLSNLMTPLNGASATSSSDTRDSELAAKLRHDADSLDAFGVNDFSGTLREAADTIDRLTSTREAVGWQMRPPQTAEYAQTLGTTTDWRFVDKELAEEMSARGWEVRPVFSSPASASPREGHVEVPPDLMSRLRDAAKIGWNACRRSLYAVCEDVQSEADRIRVSTAVGTAAEEQHAKGYHAGSKFAAKSIARCFNSMEADDDDKLTGDMSLIERLAKIDAKFTEREKTVRMGRDPAAEARAMRDDPPTIGDLAYVGRVLVTEGVADIAMDRARVGKALGDGRHRLYAVKPDPAFPIDPALIAAGRLHHSKETTPEALLSRVGDVWERAGFNSETSDFLRDISDYLSAIVAERGAA